MAKNQNPNAGVSIPADEPETTSTELAVPAHQMGEFNPSIQDMNIPKLNLVQKSSEIDGDTGSLMLDQKYAVVAPEGESDCIVLDVRKCWKEDRPFGDEQGQMVHTPEAAAALARNSDYEVIEAAELYLLLPEPADCKEPDAYAFPIAGTNYALGRLFVQKGAYRTTVGNIGTWIKFNGNHPTFSILWKLKSVMVKGKYTYFQPALHATRTKTSDEVIAFLKTLAGQA